MSRAQQVDVFWSGFKNALGLPLSGGKVYTYYIGTTTPVSLYTSFDKSTNATNPIILDSSGRAQVWGDGAYKFVVRDSNDISILTIDGARYGIPDEPSVWGGVSSGSSNAYVLTPQPAISSYVHGQVYNFIANFTNTGACTANISGLGAIEIRGGDGLTLTAGAILTDVITAIIYDKIANVFYQYQTTGITNIRVDTVTEINSGYGVFIDQLQVKDGSINTGNSGGSGNAYTLALAHPITAYADGMMFRIRANHTNTGACTLNISSLGAKSIASQNNRQLSANALLSGYWFEVVFDANSNNFKLLRNDMPLQSWTPTYGAGGTMGWSPTGSGTYQYNAATDTVFFWLEAGASTVAPASDYLRFTAPVGNPEGSSPICGEFLDGTWYMCVARASGNWFDVWKSNYLGYGIGTNRTIRIRGTYTRTA